MGKHAEADKRHINKYKMAHMIGVAEYMRDNAWRYGLEDKKDEMYVVGLLHDIGYLKGREHHEIKGCMLLDGVGFKYEYKTAILHHADFPEDLLNNNIRITPVLKLLWDADLSIDKEGYNVGHEARRKDILERYGNCEHADAVLKFLKEDDTIIKDKTAKPDKHKKEQVER